MDGSELDEKGLLNRRAVLGEAHVQRTLEGVTAFGADWQAFITRSVWGDLWGRPGLQRHTRSLLTLGLMAALGREEEFKLHVRATANTGVSRDEIKEVLIHTAHYCGVPAGNAAFRWAEETFAEMDAV